ncbi:MAG: MgtC/SapB family protein [Burkholderiales bacterium]|nr:MgtC/SapB family protein [Burkholderiales bacterium]
MPADEQAWMRLAVALGIGLLIGIERERRKGEGPARGIAGIRSFAVASLLGAVSMMLGETLLLAVAAAGVAALAAIGYARTLKQDPGLTTEIALLLTLLLGALAMREPPLAAGLAVGVAILLAARDHIHHFVRRVLTTRELNDALVLCAATLIVLPLVPDRHIGPYDAINPRSAWTIVVLMLAIGAAGHVAMRTLGPRFGLAAAGLASGFVSSTATIGSMGARVRHDPALLVPAAAGAVLSTVATILQMAVILAAASLDTLRALALPLLCAGAAAIAYGVLFTLRTANHDAPENADHGRAFSPGTALLFALAISGVTLLSAALVDRLGTTGLIAAAALTGLADAHATTASAGSLVSSGTITTAQAALPVLIGLSSNTVSKIVVAFASGGRLFAMQVVPGLLLTVAAAWLGWMVAD